MTILYTWRRIVGQRVRRLTPAEARAKLDAIRARGLTIDQPVVRELTGGHCSQSINHYVTWKLGQQAGMIPKR